MKNTEYNDIFLIYHDREENKLQGISLTLFDNAYTAEYPLETPYKGPARTVRSKPMRPGPDLNGYGLVPRSYENPAAHG